MLKDSPEDGFARELHGLHSMDEPISLNQFFPFNPALKQVDFDKQLQSYGELLFADGFVADEGLIAQDFSEYVLFKVVVKANVDVRR